MWAAVRTFKESSSTPPPTKLLSVPRITACHGWAPNTIWPGAGAVVGVIGILNLSPHPTTPGPEQQRSNPAAHVPGLTVGWGEGAGVIKSP